MILRLLCIWLVFYSLLSSLMHGTMNRKPYRMKTYDSYVQILIHPVAEYVRCHNISKLERGLVQSVHKLRQRE
jgi:hypothetical protein